MKDDKNIGRVVMYRGVEWKIVSYNEEADTYHLKAWHTPPKKDIDIPARVVHPA